jgi:hypothetical protein
VLTADINERNFDPGLMEFLKQASDKGISLYVPHYINYHRLLNEERIGDGHPYILCAVLDGLRVGPVDDIFLYSDRVHDSPCIALWESRKDLIVVGEMDNLVLRCLTAPSSNYEQLLDNREIGRPLVVLLKNLPGYRLFVFKVRSERVQTLIN